MKPSIDKFGGYIGFTSKENVVVGPSGIGFKLTDKQNFNIENKRLTNVGEAVDSSDAVTLNYISSKCLLLEDKQVNLRKRKIVNVNDPESDMDVVNKRYFQNSMDKELRDTIKFDRKKFIIDCENHNIKNISNPVDGKDAISLDYFKSNTLMYENGNFNAKRMRINNIGDPTELTDVVSKQYIENYVNSQINLKCVTFGINDEINMKNKRLSFFKIEKDPTDDSDAINKLYLDKELVRVNQIISKTVESFIKPEKGELNFKKFIININEAINNYSPITLGQARTLMQKYLYIDDKSEVNINNSIITNVKKPIERHDVANKEYVDETVRSNNTTLVEVVLREMIKDYIKPDTNGVIDLKKYNIQLVVKASENENSPVTRKQLDAFKNRINSDMSRIDEKLKVFYPASSLTARSRNREGKPISDVMSAMINDLAYLRSEIKTLKESKSTEDDDDKDDFWDRVGKLNSK